MKAIAINDLRPGYSLSVLLKVAGMARSSFYYHLKRLRTNDKYSHEKEVITSVFQQHKGRYGYRRITLELHNRGIPLNHKTVYRLMADIGLKCKVRMKKYRSYKGEVGRIAPSILARDFKTSKPNQKWATDVTEFSLFGKKCYLSPIIDLYNGEIIDYNITHRPTLDLVINMLDKALGKLNDPCTLILHSDQGWHYQHPNYRNRLKQKGIQQSMSRKGNCLDNAVMENFFGVLKSELLYLQEFNSLEHFLKEVKSYIHYYNNHRIKSRLKGMSPVKYRTHSQVN